MPQGLRYEKQPLSSTVLGQRSALTLLHLTLLTCHSGLLKGSCLEQASLWGPTWGPLGHSPTIPLVILPQPTLNHLAGTVFPQIQQPCETNRAKLALLSIPHSRRKNLRLHLGKTSVPRQVSTDRNGRVISSIMPLQKEECCNSYSCINFYILCHT